jgi:hypothetical protein
MKAKEKTKKRKKRNKPTLPIVSLEDAIKRLGDDEAWRKASKGTPYNKND